jgi:P4 family phage/plasmid primase-like protien
VLFPHSPLWFSTVCLPYPFDPGATCPTWLRVIDRNMEGDLEHIALLQEWSGLCCVFDTSFQKFLVLTGDGGNGKSVFCAFLAALLGLENVSHCGLEAFAQRFQLYQTLGKLANIAAEVGEIDKVAEGLLKSFTSGDRMPFERKMKDPIEAMPTARVVLATNSLPRFTDRSSGIWRRMELVPHRVTIPDEEKRRGLDDPQWWHEQGELPGAFNWALEGLRRLRQNGAFTQSEVCRHELAAYRLESNPARIFLEDHLGADPQESIVTQDVYVSYAKWCAANNYRPLASNSFGREIRKAFPKAKEGKVNSRDGRRVPGYLGVRSSLEGL